MKPVKNLEKLSTKLFSDKVNKIKTAIILGGATSSTPATRDGSLTDSIVNIN